MSRRLGVILALLGGGLALAIAAYVFIADFPRGLVVLACVFAPARSLPAAGAGPTLGTGTRPRLDSGVLSHRCDSGSVSERCGRGSPASTRAPRPRPRSHMGR
jgi:hypothetical protein